MVLLRNLFENQMITEKELKDQIDAFNQNLKHV